MHVSKCVNGTSLKTNKQCINYLENATKYEHFIYYGNEYIIKLN